MSAGSAAVYMTENENALPAAGSGAECGDYFGDNEIAVEVNVGASGIAVFFENIDDIGFVFLFQTVHDHTKGTGGRS